MHIILGANGHIGSVLAQTLLERGEAVTVILHNPEKTSEWQQKGAQVAVTDVADTAGLREVFRQGQRLFLLNPPANPSTDTDAEERKTVQSIMSALEGSGLEKVVAQSAYGAQPGAHLADLGVLYEMEQALAAQSIPATILRGAYYMSNWDMALPTAQEKGQVFTLFPAHFALPMVAPRDIGQLAADLMTEPASKTGIHSVEGPRYYSAADVAAAFAVALNQPVEVSETPREQWLGALRTLGFSDEAAHSFMTMADATLKGLFPSPSRRGTTSLEDYIQALVHRSG